MTNNETVRIRNDLVLQIDLIYLIYHQNDQVILLSYRQFIISTNVIKLYNDIVNSLLADTIIF